MKKGLFINRIGKERFLIGGFLLASFLLIGILVFMLIPLVNGGVGENVIVKTYLNVGTVAPEILNISVEDDSNITLLPNATKLVRCEVLYRDYNNDTNVSSVNATLYEFSTSTENGADDNNYHYTNSSCVLNNSFGSWHGVSDDQFTGLANCTFEVEYYADSGTWTCYAEVWDSTDLNDNQHENTTVEELLAIGLPDSINYGTVNSTYVSDEQVANATNFGNVEIDLQLSGYAVTPGDGYAFNCTYGNVQNISIGYEKYNLTASTSGSLSLTEFENLYINLTSSPTTEQFDLGYRQNDATNDDAWNSTYWRVYVPLGVAGTCTGNIAVSAVKSV
ncbi:hypothetical protein B6U91_02405 [Candidatus Pacearchaeota archaeon ex4484_71]|nr:MAG: hypothetical protein B6U91_02405 [Candidatus Pacearchaeota archaeon ex4484_71]